MTILTEKPPRYRPEDPAAYLLSLQKFKGARGIRDGATHASQRFVLAVYLTIADGATAAGKDQDVIDEVEVEADRLGLRRKDPLYVFAAVAGGYFDGIEDIADPAERRRARNAAAKRLSEDFRAVEWLMFQGYDAAQCQALVGQPGEGPRAWSDRMRKAEEGLLLIPTGEWRPVGAKVCLAIVAYRETMNGRFAIQAMSVKDFATGKVKVSRSTKDLCSAIVRRETKALKKLGAAQAPSGQDKKSAHLPDPKPNSPGRRGRNKVRESGSGPTVKSKKSKPSSPVARPNKKGSKTKIRSDGHLNKLRRP